MSFQSIRRILPKAIEHAGIKKHIDAVRVVESAEKNCKHFGEKSLLTKFVLSHFNQVYSKRLLLHRPPCKN